MQRVSLFAVEYYIALSILLVGRAQVEGTASRAASMLPSNDKLPIPRLMTSKKTGHMNEKQICISCFCSRSGRCEAPRTFYANRIRARRVPAGPSHDQRTFEEGVNASVSSGCRGLTGLNARIDLGWRPPRKPCCRTVQVLLIETS